MGRRKQIVLWRGHHCDMMQREDTLATKHRRITTRCGYMCVKSTEAHYGERNEITCEQCRGTEERDNG